MKPSLTSRITNAIQSNAVSEVLLPSGKAPVEIPARTYISPTDSYDDEIGFNNPQVSHAPGAMRGMFVVKDQQQASVPVTQLTSSGNTNNNSLAAIQGGIAQNPVAPATVWSSVPQMLVNVRVAGPVIVQANVSVKSSVANDVAGFALYRDGKLIGNHVTHTLPAATGSASMVQLSTMDTPPAGNHVFSMMWSPGTGTLVAVSNQRNLYAVNLSPS